MAARSTKKADKAVKFEYKGVKYVLEFDRKSAADTERLYGVSLTDIQELRLSAFDGVLRGAFLKNHPTADEGLIEEIANALPRKTEVFAALCKLYFNCVKWLFEEPDEGNAISWTAE